MPLYEVQEVHHLILFDAADIANAELSALNEIGPSGGQIFRADPAVSERGGLSLSIDPVVYAGLPEAVKAQVHDIGRRAIRQALVMNSNQFVGLILGEARQDRNYFDRFPNALPPYHQGTLF